MDTQEQEQSSRRPRKETSRKLPPFTQQFGPEMMVSHEKHGIGHVTSAYRQYVNVYFYCNGRHQNVHHRTLQFTREEQIRRGQIRKALDRGARVTVASAPGTPVAHRLLGFGTILGAADGKLLVDFDSEYTSKEEGIEASELRQIPPAPAKREDDKKKKRRRR